jgi:hypothetical protein
MTAHDQPDAEPLILRKVDHPHARDAFHVIWNGIKVVSTGLQQATGQRTFWRWWIFDAGRPYRELTMSGDTMSRDDAMTAFRQAWNEFAAEPDRLQHVIDFHADIAERSKRWGPGGE